MRLDLGQEALAQLVGVHRNAQSNYERNARVPDAEYLAALDGAGADVLYIVTGRRLDELAGAGPQSSEPSREAAEAMLKIVGARLFALQEDQLPLNVDEAWADVYANLSRVALAPHLAADLRAEADLYLAIGFRDVDAAERRKLRRKAVTGRMMLAREQLEDAVADAGAELPALVGHALMPILIQNDVRHDDLRSLVMAISSSIKSASR